jgi:anti-sigma-K factor RskA
VITTRDLSAPPPGRVYELWLQDPQGEFAPAGLMPVAGDQTLLLEGDASQAVAAGITIEPAGGSPQPTTEPIALFDLRQA